MPGGTTVGQIALELSLNKDGFTRDLGDVLGTARSTGANLAKIFQGTGRSITKGMTNAIGGVTNQIAGMARKAAGLLAVAFSTREIVNFSKACIELGSNLAEVQNVVDVTFGGASRTIDKFAKDAADSFGLSELAAKRYSSTIGAMFKSMGIAGDQVTEMSVKIAELAGDMASFYNLDADEAFDKIRSGIAGITMPLQQLGISLNEANLEAYALANGFGTAYNKMSQAEKAIVRYQYLLSVTADAQGDFARTSNSWANQVRVLQLRLEALRATIGQGLINALLPVIQVINVILAKLQRLAEAFRNFTKYIFGNAGGSGGSGTASVVSSISDSIGTAAVGAGDLATGMQDTADAAKTALKWLAPFDELNVLNSDAGGGAGGGAGGPLADLAGLMDDAGTDFLGDLADVIEEDGPSRFTEAVKRAIERGDWYGVGELFAQKLNGVIQKWNAYESGFKLGEKIRHMLEAFNGFLENFNFYDLGDKVAQWFIGLWNGIDAKTVIQFFRNVLTAIKDFVAGFIGRMIKEWEARTGLSFDEFGKWVANKLNNWIEQWKAYEDGFNFGQKIKKVLKQLNDFLKTFNFVSLGEKVADWIAGLIDGITPEVIADTIATAINSALGFGAGLTSELKKKGVPEKIGSAIGQAFAKINWGNAAEIISNIITGAAAMFNAALTSFVSEGGPAKLKEALGTIGIAIGEAFASIDGPTLAAIINAISGGLLSMFKNAITAFTDGDGWSNIWEGLKSLSLESWGLLALPIMFELAKGVSLTSLILSALGITGASTAGLITLGAAGLVIPLTFAVLWANGNETNIYDAFDDALGIEHNAGPGNTPGHKGGAVHFGTSTYYEAIDKFGATWEDAINTIKNTIVDPSKTKNFWTGDLLELPKKYHDSGGHKPGGEPKPSNWSVFDDKKSKDALTLIENIDENVDSQTEQTKKTLNLPGASFSLSGIGSTIGNKISKPLSLNLEKTLGGVITKPMKDELNKVGNLIDTSALPGKSSTLGTKISGSIKDAVKKGNIPGAFDEEATASANKFGSHDYSSGGQKAVDDIKTGMERADLPGKMTSLREGLLSKLREGDFEGNGKNIMDRTGSGMDSVNLPQKIANTAASMLHSLRWAGWENVGAQIGDAAGANFKPHFNKHLQTNITLYGSGGTPLTTVFAVPYANGGFVQGGLFLAGEVPGKTEMVGNINGRTGVASGQEITGIGDAIRETSNDEVMLLREQNRLLQALLAKDPFGTPNSNAGRWISQSQQAYKAVTG